ncbi:hypothetical protein DV738_g4993, partial [Chaetothyriales sp. CBS 135597]
MVTIHHRDQLSLGNNREALGLSAFHWGILIQPKNPKGNDSHAFDVSDASIPDPLTRRDLNPNHDWHFRPKLAVNPLLSGRLLGRIMIGKVPKDFTDDAIEALLKTVPLPVKNATPNQNCATWIVAAIQLLQDRGLAEPFNVSDFMSKALALGDQWLGNPSPNNTHNYTSRPG